MGVTPDIFNIAAIPLEQHDQFDDLLVYAQNVNLQDPVTKNIMLRAVIFIKNPVSAYFMSVYIAQYDGKNNVVPAEYLDYTKPMHISASLQDAYGTKVITTLGPFHNVVDPAQKLYIMEEIRKLYDATPYIVDRNYQSVFVNTPQQ